MPIGTTNTSEYRAKAIACAREVTAELGSRGVRVVITGSLARGGFALNSDVDFVVVDCPKALKYAIEGIVEDGLSGIPFDVVYLDEIPPSKVCRFMNGAVDASELG